MESIEYSWSGPRVAIHPSSVTILHEMTLAQAVARWPVLAQNSKGGANIDVPDMRAGEASKVTDPTVTRLDGSILENKKCAFCVLNNGHAGECKPSDSRKLGIVSSLQRGIPWRAEDQIGTVEGYDAFGGLSGPASVPPKPSDSENKKYRLDGVNTANTTLSYEGVFRDFWIQLCDKYPDIAREWASREAQAIEISKCEHEWVNVASRFTGERWQTCFRCMGRKERAEGSDCK